MTPKNLGILISRITFETLGVDVSPHLFRTAAASTAAAYGGKTPHLASAVLHHTDPRVTEQHYNRASSVSASKIYAEIFKQLPRRLKASLRYSFRWTLLRSLCTPVTGKRRSLTFTAENGCVHSTDEPMAH